MAWENKCSSSIKLLPHGMGRKKVLIQLRLCPMAWDRKYSS